MKSKTMKVRLTEMRMRDEASVDAEHELPVPLLMKARRVPIPLGFKHPVSMKTIPAGLFKALVNGNVSNANSSAEGEECMRRTVHSRLGLREILEHAARPSLDDLHVPAISHKASRGLSLTLASGGSLATAGATAAGS
jgi:hypothetical protein